MREKIPKRLLARIGSGLLLVLLLLLSTSAALAQGPTIATDKPDYAPGETVHMTGSGYATETAYDVVVIRPDDSIIKGDGNFNPDYSYTCPGDADMCWDTVTSDASGNLTYDYILNGILGLYEVYVYTSPWDPDADPAQTPVATTTFTDAAAVVEQCANDSDGSNDTCEGKGSNGWITSNVNSSKGKYFEGDFLPYRQILQGLVAGNYYCFGFGWDPSQQNLAATDYIGTFNATITNADPTWDTIHEGDVASPDDTIAIPADPALTATIDGQYSFSGTQQAGVITLWGGTFDDVFGLNYSNDGSLDLATNGTTEQQSIEYCFTANANEAIIAWGGHIAKTSEWGTPNLPSGSPYHASNGTRNGLATDPRDNETDLVCVAPDNSEDHSNIGREEVQLQADAVIPLAQVTIVKDTIPDGETDFDFTTDLPGGNFQLEDDGDDNDGSPSFIFYDDLAEGSYSVAEVVPSGWKLTNVVCTGTDENGVSVVNFPTNSTVNLDVDNGDDITCTYTNEPFTAIDLASFNVEANAGTATILWETGSEIDNAGFNLYRATAADGPWVQINSELILANGTPFGGASYTFTDQPGRGMFYYRLEDLDFYGVSTLHNPFMAELGPVIRVPWFRPSVPTVSGN